MNVALGRLGWAPDVFWRASPHEFWAAYEDWVEVNCSQRPEAGLTQDEIETLEALKKRYPDRPAGRG